MTFGRWSVICVFLYTWYRNYGPPGWFCTIHFYNDVFHRGYRLHIVSPLYGEEACFVNLLSMEPGIVLDGNPRSAGKRFQDDPTEIQVAETCCWGFILNWWKPSMFFWTGESQLKKIWHQEYNAVEKQKVIDRKLRNMEHRKVSLFGGEWFFPLILHRLKGCLSFLLGLIIMWQLDQTLKLALIFFRGMWLRHIWRIRKNTSSVSELECLTLGAPLPKNVSHGLIYLCTVFFEVCEFLLGCWTLWSTICSAKCLLKRWKNTLNPMKVVGLSSPCFCGWWLVENHQINLAQVATGSLICVGSWRLWTRCVGRFLMV